MRSTIFCRKLRFQLFTIPVQKSGRRKTGDKLWNALDRKQYVQAEKQYNRSLANFVLCHFFYSHYFCRMRRFRDIYDFCYAEQRPPPFFLMATIIFWPYLRNCSNMCADKLWKVSCFVPKVHNFDENPDIRRTIFGSAQFRRVKTTDS
jgi:hypothetical protein